MGGKSLFLALAQASDLAVVVVDRERRVRFANELAAKALEETAEKALGRRVIDLFPVAGAQVDAIVATVLASGTPSLRRACTTELGPLDFDVIPVPGAAEIEQAIIVVRGPGSAPLAEPGGFIRGRQALIEISSRLARVVPATKDAVLTETLAIVAREYGVDRASLRLATEDGTRFDVAYRYDAPGLAPIVGAEADMGGAMIARYLRGETVIIDAIDRLAEGAEERRALERAGCRAACAVPVVDGARVLGRLGFATLREREWGEMTVSRLRIFGEMFGTALSRVRAEVALRDRLHFELTLANVSGRLIDVVPARLDAELGAALEAIAQALHMDRTVLAQIDEKRERWRITHEWCALGVSSFKAAATGLNIAQFGWPQTAVLRGELINITRDEMPTDATHARAIMERTGVRSMVLVPLSVHGDVIGHILFQSITRESRLPDELIARLRFVSDVIASALARRMADESLRESESRFTEVIAHALDGVVLLSERGAILEWTPQSERLFGIPRQEALGRSFAEVALDPKDGATFGSADDVALGDRRQELTGVHRDGHTFPIEISSARMKRGGETIVALFVRDITDRKRLEQDRQRALDEVTRLKTSAERERDYLREETGREPSDGAILGRSASLRAALEELDAVATTTAAVLIHGESGVGKELFARALHARSRRAKAPLVKVNCASIPEALFESEFFGHVRGSFTGAHKDRVGRFELADGGTLFLDEVGEIPLEMQAKLLRVLQEGEFERVGDDRTRKVDVRLVAATNRDLPAEVEQGRFRRDLYYRLSVFPIDVPPLRERSEDIVPLAAHYLAIAARSAGRVGLALSEAQKAALIAYAWPGNIRELEHVIERAVILSPMPPLRLDVSLASGARTASTGPAHRAQILTEEERRKLERESIVAALDKAGGRISGEGGAAGILGLNPSTLRDRMRALGVARRA
jgi:PAS domain S-box-containing protein